MGELIATKSELRQGKVKVPLDTRTKIIVVPDALEREIVGKLFDSGKTFLFLDRAIEGLQYVQRLAVRAAADKDVLIVVHTDPLLEASKSEKLSKDRALIVAAWFEGEVDTWLDNYASSIPKLERWGAREDHHMLKALGDFDAASEGERPANADARYDALVHGYQRSRQLKDDGISGPVTRKQLVQEYFALAKVTDKLQPVPPRGEAAKTNAKLTKHGAGPHFSVADAETKRTAARAEAKAATQSAAAGAPPKKVAPAKNAASNGAAADTSSTSESAIYARLDFFFFFNKEGMDPAPGGADGEEFLEWVALAAADHKRFRAVAPPPKEAKTLSLQGGHFQTGSAVLLPGDAPTSDQGTVPTSLGALAMALRFNEERPGHKLLIAGHTDSVGSDKDNDKLSIERAELVHAVLTGDRDTFVDIAHDTGKVSDWKQILKWAAAVFPSVEKLVSAEDAEEEGSNETQGSPSAASGSGSSKSGGSSSDSEPKEGELGTGFAACDPGPIDDNAKTGEAAAEAFQTSYNENYKLLGGSAKIGVDGVVGKETWGAIFDLYQYNMAQELGEDLDGVQTLRDLVELLPTKKPYVGFGEHFPADGRFKDNVESEANRRAELLFFKVGHEPDIGILDGSPELTEIYDGDEFVREELGMETAKRILARVKLETMEGLAIPGISFVARTDAGVEKKGKLDSAGLGAFKAPQGSGFSIEYLEPEKIRANGLAARLVKAIDEGDHQAILGLLHRSRETFDLISSAVDEHFPRKSKLVDDIRTATARTESSKGVEHCLVGLGFDAPGIEELIAHQEPSSNPDLANA